MADNEHEGGSQPPSLGESGGRGPAAAAAAAAARDTTGSAAASRGTASGSPAAEETAAEEGSNHKESAHEALARLSKLKAQKQAPYWEFLEPVLVTETVDGAEVQLCKLQCKKGGCVCAKLLSPNPSRTA